MALPLRRILHLTHLHLDLRDFDRYVLFGMLLASIALILGAIAFGGYD